MVRHTTHHQHQQSTSSSLKWIEISLSDVSVGRDSWLIGINWGLNMILGSQLINWSSSPPPVVSSALSPSYIREGHHYSCEHFLVALLALHSTQQLPRIYSRLWSRTLRSFFFPLFYRCIHLWSPDTMYRNWTDISIGNWTYLNLSIIQYGCQKRFFEILKMGGGRSFSIHKMLIWRFSPLQISVISIEYHLLDCYVDLCHDIIILSPGDKYI